MAPLLNSKRGEGTMNRDRIAQNLAAVENHFHSEALNEVEAALETFTDDILWEAPALNGLNRSFSGKEATAKNYLELTATNAQLPSINRDTSRLMHHQAF
jgi:hypothetical protein